jgi:hypothetical protein
MDIYIFGYQSILSKKSLAATLGPHALNGEYVPVWLDGYQRNWDAVREFQSHASKRYVAATDWCVAKRVAFCNLQAVAGAAVNGICQRVPAAQLEELDFREQGYTRVDVTDRIRAYPGHSLKPGVACHTYIDLQPSANVAPTSLRYYEMGLHGARDLDVVTPGFLPDYISSTTKPHALLADPVFVFFSQDGLHLWLLNEQDSSLTLLLRFARSQIASAPRDMPIAQVAELSRPTSEALAWLDLRSRADRSTEHPWIPAAMAAEIVETPVKSLHALSNSSFWLCRLAATQSPGISRAILSSLCNDPDYWVRRAATQQLK